MRNYLLEKIKNPVRSIAQLAKVSFYVFVLSFILWVMALPLYAADFPENLPLYTDLSKVNGIIKNNEIYLTDPIPCEVGEQYNFQISFFGIPNKTPYVQNENFSGILNHTCNTGFLSNSRIQNSYNEAQSTGYLNFGIRNTAVNFGRNCGFQTCETVGVFEIIRDPGGKNITKEIYMLFDENGEFYTKKDAFRGVLGADSSDITSTVKKGVQDTTGGAAPVGAAVVGVPLAFVTGRWLVGLIRSSV